MNEFQITFINDSYYKKIFFSQIFNIHQKEICGAADVKFIFYLLLVNNICLS